MSPTDRWRTSPKYHRSIQLLLLVTGTGIGIGLKTWMDAARAWVTPEWQR